MLRFLVAMAVVAAAAAAPSARLARPTRSKTPSIYDEMRAWKEGGYPELLQFPDGKGKSVWGTVVVEQPELAVKGLFRDLNDTVEYSDDELGAKNSDVKFHVYTKGNNYSSVEGTQVSLNLEDFLAAGWDPALPTKIVIHGFTNNIKSPIIQDIKNAYMTHSDYDVNVVGVDWGVLCPELLYITARLNVPFAGRRVGALLAFLIEQELTAAGRLHVIGHSLGAHVAGLSAKKLYETKGVRPQRVTGLDPAWPLFILTPETGRLNQDDAEVVDVIHTCAGLLGFPKGLGTTDFYPNGGRNQPGCGLDLVGLCAHGRSYEYFTESITEGKGYQADFCDNSSDARHGKCTGGEDEGCMGDEIQFKKKGSYYLKTDDLAPTKKC